MYFIKNPVAFFVIFFLFLGAFIRLYQLDRVPYGFHEDEAYIGYNAYSLLKTLRDNNNRFLPLAIDQFGDFRPAGLHYLTIPSVALFGLTVFATRFPVAFFGSISILLFYFLCFEIYKDKQVALISAGLLAITPWHVIASRATSESIVSMFFVLLGLYLFFRSLHARKKVILYLVLAFFAFILSFLFYHAARFFIPLMLIYLSFFIFFRFSQKKKVQLIYVSLFVGLLIALMGIFTLGHGTNRPSEISIFASPRTSLLVTEQIREGKAVNPFITHLFHNKFTGYMYAFLDNYQKHFDSDFLYLHGGYPERYMIPLTGNFYLIEGIFTLVGLAYLLVSLLRDKQIFLSNNFFPLIWLLIGPVPAALTYEDIPHFQRAIFMLPAFLMLSAYGISICIKHMKYLRIKNWLVYGIYCIFFLNFFMFLDNYFIHSVTHRPWYRSEGEKELVDTLQVYTTHNKEVIMTSQNENRLIFYLFFDKIDPRFYHKIGSPKEQDGLNFQHMTFTPKHCPLEANGSGIATGNPDYIYVDIGECKNAKNAEVLKNIKRPDGTIAFKIIKLNP